MPINLGKNPSSELPAPTAEEKNQMASVLGVVTSEELQTTLSTELSGKVSIEGTPSDNRIAVWKSLSSIEGDENLTWDGTILGINGTISINNDIDLDDTGNIVNANRGEFATLNVGTDFSFGTLTVDGSVYVTDQIYSLNSFYTAGGLSANNVLISSTTDALNVIGKTYVNSIYTTTITPKTTNAYNIGSPTFKYNYIYTNNGVFNEILANNISINSSTGRLSVLGETYVNSLCTTTLTPKTTDIYDIGSSSLKYNEIYVNSGVYFGDSAHIYNNGLTWPNHGIGCYGSFDILGNLTVDTDTLFVDAANDRVGIGTTSPSEKLTVSGNISASGSIEAATAYIPIITSDTEVTGELTVSGQPELSALTDNHVLTKGLADNGYGRVNVYTSTEMLSTTTYHSTKSWESPVGLDTMPLDVNSLYRIELFLDVETINGGYVYLDFDSQLAFPILNGRQGGLLYWTQQIDMYGYYTANWASINSLKNGTAGRQVAQGSIIVRTLDACNFSVRIGAFTGGVTYTMIMYEGSNAIVTKLGTY